MGEWNLVEQQGNKTDKGHILLMWMFSTKTNRIIVMYGILKCFKIENVVCA